MVDGNGNGASHTQAENVATPVPLFNDQQWRALSVILDRQLYMRLAGMQFNGRRDLYEKFGYDRVVTAMQYREEYARGGIAKTIVDAYPDATWRGGVEMYEDENPKVETAFEKDWKALEDNFDVWGVLHDADVLAGLSTYSVILIGAEGSLDSELPKGKPGGLLYLQPFWGGGGPGDQGSGSSMRTQSTDTDVTIERFDKDPASPRFGEPTAYRIRRTDLSSSLLAKDVHWSRIIHICEGALDNRVYGPPRLEAVWNLLFDLEKLTGGGSESFFQRAKHALNLNMDKDMNLTDDQMKELKQKLDEYQHNITTMLPTRGIDVKLLESAVANFSGPADAILTQIAGTCKIPKRILTGSEMGELASTQDASNFNTRVQDRRTGYAGPKMARKLAKRLIDYGYLTTPKQYQVGWPVEESMDEGGKADYAVKLTMANKTNGDTVFTTEEIRDMAFDMEPLTQAQLDQIDQRAADKVQAAQEVMGTPAPGAEGDQPPVPAKPTPFQRRAAEDVAILKVLETAIREGDRETIDDILFRGLGDVPGHEFQYVADVGSTEGAPKDAASIPHNSVVAKSKYGEVTIKQSNGRTEYFATRKNGESLGTRKTMDAAKDLLREPSNAGDFRSGYMRPNVKWSHPHGLASDA